MRTTFRILQGIALGGVALLGCGEDDPAPPRLTPDAGGGDDQTPPIGAQAVEEWLSQGAYLDWACEPSVHESRDPSPHGFNRVCSNALISDNAEGTEAWPQGAAAVKELYDALEGSEPIGYALYVKTAADSADGANWYWYERVGQSVFADGLGNSGTARSSCVGCHGTAGIDADRTPSPGARDYVFTPVSVN